MTVARSQLVDVNVTPWYHVISKTVRGAWLLGQGVEDHRQRGALEIVSCEHRPTPTTDVVV